MQYFINIKTDKKNGLYDITSELDANISLSKINRGITNIYTQGATAAIMVQENWDNSVQNDVVNLLSKLIPNGVWLHDLQDGNGDAHLKAGLIGTGECIPIIDGKLGLSQWQNVFLCKFDGPGSQRNIVVTLISAS